MREKNTGGPAFPCNSPDGTEYYKGLSLRDYFAARCPESELPVGVTWIEIADFKGWKRNTESEHRDWNRDAVREFICVERYKYADAMLKAREA